ncbi:sensor histidine kinase [Microbacterium plantarum]|uniref:sensor histidine kinase n=1 Tax=Microbacterium plantarum TaxID=1816425 RepID=UPI002B49086E|nr:histidine kinase [Microbacterium plantarum]WRK18394.1 histidine kinase [Microbacterium plantarum]
MTERQRRLRHRHAPGRVGADERGFSALPRRGRIILLLVLAVMLVVDIALAVTEPGVAWRGLMFGLPAMLATALFIWWPPAAATSLLLIALVQITAGQDGSDVLYLAGVAGLVVYTSPLWFVSIYVVATLILTILASTVLGIFANTALPALALVVAISASIGWALRAAHGRELRLAGDVAALAQARTAAIEAERERIADELHDIIAHDITLVSMHARVLERVDDEALRDQSVRAIRAGADQALADIRRMLRIVRDDGASPLQTPDDHVPTPNIAAAFEEARDALLQLGAAITVRYSDVSVSSTIEQALVHLIREGTTNIAKHAPANASVTITLEVLDDDVCLELTNSIDPAPTTSGVPSSGYGLDRLRERVSVSGGHFTSGPADGRWVLTARLPAR